MISLNQYQEQHLNSPVTLPVSVCVYVSVNVYQFSERDPTFKLYQTISFKMRSIYFPPSYSQFLWLCPLMSDAYRKSLFFFLFLICEKHLCCLFEQQQKKHKILIAIIFNFLNDEMSVVHNLISFFFWQQFRQISLVIMFALIHLKLVVLLFQAIDTNNYYFFFLNYNQSQRQCI